MPTDLRGAIAKKAELRKLRQDECCGVLLMPLIMCILTMIQAIVSPSFAEAVIISGLY